MNGNGAITLNVSLYSTHGPNCHEVGGLSPTNPVYALYCPTALNHWPKLLDNYSKWAISFVIGAGSFGHIAKEYRLAEGNIPDLEQNEAIQLVRRDMDQLHSHVIDALRDLPIHSHPPREFVTNTGSTFHGDLDAFLAPGIHLTFLVT